MFPTLFSKKAALLLGIGLGILTVVLWSSQPAARAQKSGTDIQRLKAAFGGNQVSVFFLNNNPPAAQGQIASMVEVFGRRYLRITTNEGKAWLIDVERIVAIKQN